MTLDGWNDRMDMSDAARAAPTGYALFDTAIGHCGIAWGERGLTGVLLPEDSEAATRQYVENLTSTLENDLRRLERDRRERGEHSS